ncbi:DUF1559 domain-containing protein [Blastopirellula sp. JC732]|uniref:DUF1559 domain-containing protein n=1 Tax=Blastopirellula sediminis TaxID=2894196 RepID=A0A9X1SHN2_9BACT|nr:DUF1559 domain-containing protein [Blastopirellula sediminis]MCC9605265.1 DUF1559 domain-containing protein [Blastopirellula sediminis]MCC9631435.1 DUF1559 domain-containing protein [Blastopirellula sediminis]
MSPHAPARYSRRGFTLVELLVVIAIIGVLIALLLPAVQQAREAARRSQCINNMKQLALAMHNFHDTFREFPLNAYGPDAGVTWNGWERFSANYKILPFIEQNALYEQFNLGGSWGTNRNGPMNVSLNAFLCPSAQPAPPSSFSWGGPGTNYAWCSGSSLHTAWSANETNANGLFNMRKERNMAYATDGLSNTMFLSEILSGDGVAGQPKYPYDVFYVQGGDGPFTSVANKAYPTQAELTAIGTAAQSPVDERSNNGTLWAWYAHGQSLFNASATPNWQYPTAGGNCCPGGAHDWGWGVIPPRSLHPGGVNAGFGDGSVHFIANTVDLVTFQRLGSCNDGQVLGEY